MKQLFPRELTQKVLGTYRKIDHLRPKLNHFMPIEWNGKRWCAATDARGVVLMPENEENKLPEPTEDTVDVVRIIPAFNMNQEVSISAIEKALSLVPIVDIKEMEECESCEGNGHFDHYGHVYNCQECDESGEVETGRTFKGFDESYVLSIAGALFDPEQFKRMMLVVTATRAERIHLMYVKTVAWFELGNGIIIGIATLNEPEDKEVVDIELYAAALAVPENEKK